MICFALSALLLGSDYLILTEDTDYYKSRATFMVKGNERREGGNGEKEMGVQSGQMDHTYLGGGWVAGEGDRKGCLSGQVRGQGPMVAWHSVEQCRF